MPQQSSPERPASSADAGGLTELLGPLVDACAELLNSHHRLTEGLHDAGLVNDQATTAILAREDQIDAAITDLRTRWNLHTGGHDRE